MLPRLLVFLAPLLLLGISGPVNGAPPKKISIVAVGDVCPFLELGNLVE